MSTNKQANRLINEKSPYLLQHAYNPVDWYAWGEEAFSKAKAEDKPIFLSIGYSSCHWCHVMEDESFESEEIAKLLNENYVSIKVDREERADIDAVYMNVCQTLTGSGGWPLTIIMTPDQKPFFAATYIPKTARYGQAGLDTLLPRVAQIWGKDKKSLLESGNEISKAVNSLDTPDQIDVQPQKEFLQSAYEHFTKRFDSVYSGFGDAPKFPSPHNLMFLLRYSYYEKDKTASDMVEKTLIEMYKGGIFDHIGGGFSRYSTDRQWLVPHFEKMLYDNALLIYTYTQMYQVSKDPIYKKIAEKTISYVLNELTDENYGFYCGQDADSEGVEGKYYVFTPSEIVDVLGKEKGEAFNRQYNITKEGDFEGSSIPNLLGTIELQDTDPKDTQKLYEYRLSRTSLNKDDKVVTSWNGLMIVALAKAGAAFESSDYKDAAIKAYENIKERLSKEDGRLYVRWRDGEAKGIGKIDDYAFVAWSLLELYNCTFDVKYIKETVKIADILIEHFWDNKEGGFFMYADDDEKLLTRPKEIYDGAMPSGNSVLALVLIKLYELTADIKWQNYADRQFDYLAGNIKDYPWASAFALIAMTHVLYPTKQLICTGSNFDFKSIYNNFLPELSTIVKTEENGRELASAAPFTESYEIGGENKYYLCENGQCKQPSNSLDFEFIDKQL
ncbi:MAG: thioredoxin domain-containing protein [Bacillota bacterium]|nr:thioredoxin domain-containing protein [Bacillota bacterium]